MVFNLGKLLAVTWGVEFESEEYCKLHREMRERASATTFTIAPCGPPCPMCHDNSYTCGCDVAEGEGDGS